MDRVNSDISYFLEHHEQEIINCCRKARSNKEIVELLETKYDREVPLTTFRKFKARLKLTKGDFLETLLEEIKVMKTLLLMKLILYITISDKEDLFWLKKMI